MLRNGKAERITIYRLCPWVLTPWRNKLDEFEKIVSNMPMINVAGRGDHYDKGLAEKVPR